MARLPRGVMLHQGLCSGESAWTWRSGLEKGSPFLPLVLPARCALLPFLPPFSVTCNSPCALSSRLKLFQVVFCSGRGQGALVAPAGVSSRMPKRPRAASGELKKLLPCSLYLNL